MLINIITMAQDLPVAVMVIIQEAVVVHLDKEVHDLNQLFVQLGVGVMLVALQVMVAPIILGAYLK